jgi:protein gp37
MTLSLERGWTKLPWTTQNEAENVKLKIHKLAEPYTLAEPARIFVNSMSDMFHRAIPDWYKAVVWCVMLDNPRHTFQVLTKRSADTIRWHERFTAVIGSDEFRQFAESVTDRRVKAALLKPWDSPWMRHIWIGVSVEDARVLHWIVDLQRCPASVRFVSAEPLLGDWGSEVDLSGIHWVIVGGESGKHMGRYEDRHSNPRWMKMEWARRIRDLCVAQNIAFFFKQDSGYSAELRPYLVEEDGRRTIWEQYPDHVMQEETVQQLRLFDEL